MRITAAGLLGVVALARPNAFSLELARLSRSRDSPPARVFVRRSLVCLLRQLTRSFGRSAEYVLAVTEFMRDDPTLLLNVDGAALNI